MNKNRKTSHILNVFQYDHATGIIGLNGAPVSGYGLYLTTNINDGSVGIDSSASINALYLLKNTTKQFEISYDTSGATKIFRLLPYQSGSSFQIGNPSNAANSNTDYVFISESVYGNVLIGPGIGNAVTNLTGATAATHKIQFNGAIFANNSIQATSFVITGGASTGFLKADGTIDAVTYLSGNQSITVSGDATGSGTTAITLTLANTAVTPGTYGSTTLVPVVTVDSKGRITSVTTAAISGSLTFTGDVTGSGTTGTSTGLTLAASGVTAGTYTKVTVDSKGRVTVGASASTTDISEGTNLYYTDARVGTYLTANSYATQSYVGTQVANLVAAAPATLDTLNELAAALGNDPSFATTVSTSIGTKVPQTRTLTINGTGYDLSADRSWTINSMVYPGAGIALSTGTAWGTSITDNSANWNTAYGWGNHASGGYLTSATAATTYASLTGTYANPAFISSLAYSKITGVPAFLTSYTETDPYRVTTVAVSGTSTKTITLTRADASTVTTTWTDIDTDTNTYVTSAGFSGGTLTLTRNDAGTVTVSLDGRYYLATNPSGYITGINSSAVTTALGFTPLSSSGSVTINGDLTVGVGNSSNIYMNDGDEGQRQIHCNSNRIGFLTQAGAWGAYCDDSGNWAAVNFSGSSSGTNTGDQTNISGTATYATQWGTSAGYANFSSTAISASVGWLFGTTGNGTYAPVSLASVATLLSLGSLAYSSATIPTNNNQITNGAGYITSSGSITGTAGSTGLLTIDNSVAYGRSGLQFAQSYSTAGNTASNHNTPTGDWWHVIRMNHANGAGYYADLAVSMTTNLGLSRRVISNGAQLSNWVTILDALNYNSYSPTLTGTGASGTWGISITGNAATVGGYAVSGTVGANTVVIRDVNNYIYAHYINSNVSETENPTINSFFTSNGDGWLRKSSLAHVRSQLGNYGGWITGYTETDTLASVTGRGASTSTAITISGIDSALKVQHNGNSTAWRGRLGSFNSTADVSSFLGTYGTIAGVFAHNNALTAWADLYINTVDGTTSGAAVRLPSTTYINGYAAVYASGTWGISITGESHGIANNGNNISGMGPITTWDSRPGVGMAGFGISWHTGVSISGYPAYGGVRLYSAGYPTHASSVLRLEASDSVKTFGGLYSDGNPVLVQNTSISYSFGLNDNKLYLRTNTDNNHYLWNNASDFEEMVYYNGTGFKVTSSTGVSTCVFESVASSGMLFIGSADASRTYIGDASRSGIAIGGSAYPQLMLNAVGGGNTTHGATISMTGLKSAGGYRRWVMGIPNLDPTTFSLGWADDLSNPHYGAGVAWGASSAKFSWDTSGNFIASGDITAYGTPSDLRLKDLKGKVFNALSSIIKLNGYRFDWKEDKSKLFVLKEDIGVIAQEVADVFPELARTNEDGFMSVRYQGLTAVLIEAIKEQQLQIEELKNKLDGLTR